MEGLRREAGTEFVTRVIWDDCADARLRICRWHRMRGGEVGRVRANVNRGHPCTCLRFKRAEEEEGGEGKERRAKLPHAMPAIRDLVRSSEGPPTDRHTERGRLNGTAIDVV